MPQVNLREKIIEHAETVFRQRGFDGTSIQDITDAAGVPKGSFYNHFKSKQSLAAEVLHRFVQERLVGLDRPGTPLARLQAYFQLQIERTERTGIDYGCLLGTFAAEVTTAGDEVRREAVEALAIWTASVATVIAEAQEQGEVVSQHPAQDLAAYMIDAFEGTTLRVKVTGDRHAFTSFLEMAMSILATEKASIE